MKQALSHNLHSHGRNEMQWIAKHIETKKLTTQSIAPGAGDTTYYIWNAESQTAFKAYRSREKEARIKDASPNEKYKAVVIEAHKWN